MLVKTVRGSSQATACNVAKAKHAKNAYALMEFVKEEYKKMIGEATDKLQSSGADNLTKMEMAVLVVGRGVWTTVVGVVT